MNFVKNFCFNIFLLVIIKSMRTMEYLASSIHPDLIVQNCLPCRQYNKKTKSPPTTPAPYSHFSRYQKSVISVSRFWFLFLSFYIRYRCVGQIVVRS